MTQYWIHKINVAVAELDFANVKISIDVKRESDQTPTTGEVLLYNIAADKEQQIFDRRDTIVINAGFADNVGLIFDGYVDRIERERKGTDRVTRLKIINQLKSVEKIETTSGYVSIAYSEPTDLTTIVSDIVKQLGFKVGPTELVPDMMRTFHWAGQGHLALNVALRNSGVTWYEDDGTVRFNRAGTKTEQSDLDSLDVSQALGMVGAPSVIEDDGARVRSLLRHNARIGAIVNLDSERITGQYKIVALRHFGDNWTGDLYTDMELKINE